MRFRMVVIGALAIGAMAIPVVGWAGEEPASRVPATIPRDPGAGEELWLVVGGTYPSRSDASAAAGAMPFGDLQGYYVVPVAQFAGLGERVAGSFVLASAFRTEEGARAFADLASAFGAPASVLEGTLWSVGSAYAGLGQEAALDGSGPLLWPVEEEE